MKIFLSWSGAHSREIAETFADWIKCVIQSSSPWVSSHNIESGSVWFREINDQLRDISVGIIFLTKENKDRRWILFEAGALAKGLSTNRVCTFLINLEPADIEDPLAQFNHTWIDKSSIAKLVATINRTGELPISDSTLSSVFEVYWPVLLVKLEEINKKYPATEDNTVKPEDEIQSELLDGIRTLNNRMARLESEIRKPDIAEALKNMDKSLNDENIGSNAIRTIGIGIGGAPVSARMIHKTIMRSLGDAVSRDSFIRELNNFNIDSGLKNRVLTIFDATI